MTHEPAGMLAMMSVSGITCDRCFHPHDDGTVYDYHLETRPQLVFSKYRFMCDVLACRDSRTHFPMVSFERIITDKSTWNSAVFWQFIAAVGPRTVKYWSRELDPNIVKRR